MKIFTSSIIIIFAFLLAGKKCLSQSNASGWITTFSFQQLSGGVVLVQGLLNDYKDTLNFILDTGSGGISLDSSTVIELAIPITPSERTIRGIAGVHKVSFLYNAQLRLPGLTMDSLNFHVNNYEILSSVYGIKIDGIIGLSFFSRYIVHIDYDKLEIGVYRNGDFKYKKGGYLLKPLINSIPIMMVDFADHRKLLSRYYMDTGAGLCFLISEEFARDSAIFKPKKKFFHTQAEGLGGKTSMRITTLKRVKIGPYKFKNVPTHIYEDAYNITAYPYLAGLVGNDLLRRFNITLNYARREVHLIPNTHYYSPFDYAYTGLGIYSIEGKITVEDVIKGSPAESAGILPGDVIVSISGNFSNNIQVYKNLLQAPKQRLKMIIRRNGQLTMLTLKPKSIL